MRTKSSERRQAILDAAKAVMEEVGYEQATMAQISARVGGSKATLYSYFDSKEALFLELVNQVAEQHIDQLMPLIHSKQCCDLPKSVEDFMSVLDPSADLAETLHKFGELVLSRFHTPAMLSTRRMIIAASNRSNIGKLYYEQGPAKAFKIAQTYFATLMETGHIRQADPSVVEAHWRGLLTSEVMYAGLLNARPELEPDEIKAVVTRAVDVFLRAYGPEKSA
jgi:AcrR family transcriptional regulator